MGAKTKIERASADMPVDCGAFWCPQWFAEALAVFIALEAAEQGKLPRKVAVKKAQDWLRKYRRR